MVWYRVKSSLVPWVTSDDPFHAKPQSIDYTIARDRFVCVLTAGRGKPANTTDWQNFPDNSRVKRKIALIETDT
jgi:hypothetical protein